MSSANGLMRLMGEEGEERPIDKYARQKEDISIWYKEMDDFGLTKDEQITLEPYFKTDYGVPPDQENLMLMLMDKDICGFTLREANRARKIVGKKQMSKIPELHEKILKQAKSDALGRYVWKCGVGPEMGYAFSRIHSLRYSFIGVQTLYIATNWNPIYWNTACLIVNSGSLEGGSETKTANTDYGKLRKAVNEIKNAGINITLTDINNSDFGFKPDIKNNRIMFGLKALLNVNDDLVYQIINNRPYTSPKDFVQKINPKKQSMISLIKGGAFDSMMDRKECMVWYIWETCEKKKNITLQNMASLIKYNLLPEELDMSKRVFEFNRYLKAVLKKPGSEFYNLDERALTFLSEIDCEKLILSDLTIGVKTWDNVYQKWMDNVRAWISKNKAQTLEDLNTIIFKEAWDKYALGTYSTWEMEVLCYYYHEHELSNIDMLKYGLINFNNLSTEPVVEHSYKRGNKAVNLFKIEKICGTCIAKNKPKGIVTLLTTSGVVNVKFSKEFFSMFDRQISQRDEDGKKHIVERSWFNRGSMIVVQGIRSGDDFLAKKYQSTPGHMLYKIDQIDGDELILRSSRYQGEEEEDNG